MIKKPKKKALIVACSYGEFKPRQLFLQGNITSARYFARILEYRGFDIDFISDIDDFTPDADAILKALVRLVEDAAENDILLFVFSGYGGISHSNNAAHVMAGSERIGYGQFTFIKDYDLHRIFRTKPEFCSFTMIADLCRLDPLVADEIFGDMTNTSIYNSIRGSGMILKDPSSSDSGILITSCQNEKVTFNFCLDGKPRSLFLHSLTFVVNLFGTHPSNRSLVEQIRSYMTDERVLPKLAGFVGRIQQPGLYCNSVQADQAFLSLELGYNVEWKNCHYHDEILLCRRMEELSLSCDHMTSGGSSRSHEATTFDDSSSSSGVQLYGEFGFVAPFEGIQGNHPSYYQNLYGSYPNMQNPSTPFYNYATMNYNESSTNSSYDYPPRSFGLFDDVNNNDA